MFDSLWPQGLYSSPDFSVHGISQARKLEWVPCPSPGALPHPGVKPTSPAPPALAGDSSPLHHLGGSPCAYRTLNTSHPAGRDSWFLPSKFVSHFPWPRAVLELNLVQLINSKALFQPLPFIYHRLSLHMGCLPLPISSITNIQSPPQPRGWLLYNKYCPLLPLQNCP